MVIGICLILFLQLSLSQHPVKFGYIISPYTTEEQLTEFETTLSICQSKYTNQSSNQIYYEAYEIFVDLIEQNDELKWSIPPEIAELNLNVILDLSNSMIYSQFLVLECEVQQLTHIVIGRVFSYEGGEQSGPYSFYVDVSSHVQGELLAHIINMYNWELLSIYYSNEQDNIEQLTAMKKNLKEGIKLYDEMLLDTNDPQIEKTIYERFEEQKDISEAKIYILLTNSYMASILLNAGEMHELGGSGYGWLLNSNALRGLGESTVNTFQDIDKSFLNILQTGAVGLLKREELDDEDIQTQGYYKILNLLVQADLDGANVSGTAMRDYLLANHPQPQLREPLLFNSNGIRREFFYSGNMVDFVIKTPGFWDYDKMDFQEYEGEDILWPGARTEAPDDKRPVLTLAVLLPERDLFGDNTSWAPSVKNSVNMAIDDFNSQDDLNWKIKCGRTNNEPVTTYYILEPKFLDTAMRPELTDILLQRIQKDNILAYIGPYLTDVTKEYTTLQEQDPEFRPVITYGSEYEKFSYSGDYPSLLRTVQQSPLQAVAMALYVKERKDWKELAIIYTDDDYGIDLHKDFVSNIADASIDIINELEEDQVIKIDSNSQITEFIRDQVEQKVSRLVELQVKVIVFLGIDLVGVEVAYKAYIKELYGNEYNWIGTKWMTDNAMKYLDLTYPDDKEDILKVYNGAFGLQDRIVAEESGEKFRQDYKALFNSEPTSQASLAYDAVVLVGCTINSMVSRNEDFTARQSFMDALRAGDFQGATGRIKFAEYKNDRRAYGYDMLNMQKGERIIFATYNTTDSQIFIPKLDANGNPIEVIWGEDSSTHTDSDWGFEYDCPFALHMSTLDLTGLAINISVGLFFLIITLILTLFSWRKWKYVQFDMLNSPAVRTWKDTLVEATIPIEFFQMIAISPYFESVQIAMEAISNIFMLDVIKVSQEDKSSYWNLLIFVCIVCYIWVFLVIFIIFDCEKISKALAVIPKAFQSMNSLLLPFLGNTMFIPFTSIILDAIVCDHRAQGSYYVWRDCYTNCWTDFHYYHVIMGGVALGLYEPLAVLSRPLWQQTKTGVNVTIKPTFMLYKTCMQLLLVVVGKSLQGPFKIAHGFVFTFLIAVFTWYSFRTTPFNYGRCNLWQIVSLIAVGSYSLIATFSFFYEPMNIAWFCALCGVWFVLFIITYYLQNKRFPIYLVAPGEEGNGKSYSSILPLSSEEMNRSSMYLNPKRVPVKGAQVIDDEYEEDANILPPEINDVSQLDNGEIESPVQDQVDRSAESSVQPDSPSEEISSQDQKANNNSNSEKDQEEQMKFEEQEKLVSEGNDRNNETRQLISDLVEEVKEPDEFAAEEKVESQEN